MAAAMQGEVYDLGPVSDLQAGVLYSRVMGNTPVVIVLAEGEINVLHGICPHRGARVAHGKVVSAIESECPGKLTPKAGSPVLVCPWHGWEYALSSGRAVVDESLRLRKYEAEVVDGRVVTTGLEL